MTATPRTTAAATRRPPKWVRPDPPILIERDPIFLCFVKTVGKKAITICQLTFLPKDL